MGGILLPRLNLNPGRCPAVDRAGIRFRGWTQFLYLPTDLSLCHKIIILGWWSEMKSRQHLGLILCSETACYYFLTSFCCIFSRRLRERLKAWSPDLYSPRLRQLRNRLKAWSLEFPIWDRCYTAKTERLRLDLKNLIPHPCILRVRPFSNSHSYFQPIFCLLHLLILSQSYHWLSPLLFLVSRWVMKLDRFHHQLRLPSSSIGFTLAQQCVYSSFMDILESLPWYSFNFLTSAGILLSLLVVQMILTTALLRTGREVQQHLFYILRIPFNPFSLICSSVSNRAQLP